MIINIHTFCTIIRTFIANWWLIKYICATEIFFKRLIVTSISRIIITIITLFTICPNTILWILVLALKDQYTLFRLTVYTLSISILLISDHTNTLPKINYSINTYITTQTICITSTITCKTSRITLITVVSLLKIPTNANTKPIWYLFNLRNTSYAILLIITSQAICICTSYTILVNFFIILNARTWIIAYLSKFLRGTS